MAELGAPDGRAWRIARLTMGREFNWQPSEIETMDAIDFLEDYQLAQEMLPDEGS